MNNTFNIEQSKRKKTVQRMVLGVLVSLLFVFSLDAILWAVGALGTTITVRMVVVLNFIFVLLSEVILWVIGFWRNAKKSMKSKD